MVPAWLRGHTGPLWWPYTPPDLRFCPCAARLSVTLLSSGSQVRVLPGALLLRREIFRTALGASAVSGRPHGWQLARIEREVPSTQQDRPCLALRGRLTMWSGSGSGAGAALADQPCARGPWKPTAGAVSGRLGDAEDSQQDEDHEDGDDDVQDVQHLALLGPFCAQPVQPTKRIHRRTVPAARCHPRAAGGAEKGHQFEPPPDSGDQPGTGTSAGLRQRRRAHDQPSERRRGLAGVDGSCSSETMRSDQPCHLIGKPCVNAGSSVRQNAANDSTVLASLCSAAVTQPRHGGAGSAPAALPVAATAPAARRSWRATRLGDFTFTSQGRNSVASDYADEALRSTVSWATMRPCRSSSRAAVVALSVSAVTSKPSSLATC